MRKRKISARCGSGTPVQDNKGLPVRCGSGTPVQNDNGLPVQYGSALMPAAAAAMLFIGICAIGSLCGLQGKPSLAYFTTYASAKGGYELAAGPETEIHEEIDGLKKHIRIENTGEGDCFVRVKAFAGSVTDIMYSAGGGDWQEGEDGYWYYNAILAPGEITGELTASITVPEGMADDFNVVVIQECTPALYRQDGTPYGNWGRKAQVGLGGEAEG